MGFSKGSNLWISQKSCQILSTTFVSLWTMCLQIANFSYRRKRQSGYTWANQRLGPNRSIGCEYHRLLLLPGRIGSTGSDRSTWNLKAAQDYSTANVPSYG